MEYQFNIEQLQKEANDTLEHLKEEKDKQIEDIKSQFQSEREDLEHERDETINNISELQQQYNEIQQSMQQLKSNNEILENEYKNLENNSKQNEEYYNSEISSKDQIIAEKEANIDELSRKYNELTDILSSNEDQEHAKIAQLQEQIDKLFEKDKELNDYLENYKSSNNTLYNANQELQYKNEDLEREKALLQNKIINYDKTISDNNAKFDEMIDKLEGENNGLLQNNEVLAQKYEIVVNKEKDLLEENKRLLSENKNLLQEQERMIYEKENLNKQYQILKEDSSKKIDELKEHYESLLTQAHMKMREFFETAKNYQNESLEYENKIKDLELANNDNITPTKPPIKSSSPLVKTSPTAFASPSGSTPPPSSSRNSTPAGKYDTRSPFSVKKMFNDEINPTNYQAPNSPYNMIKNVSNTPLKNYSENTGIILGRPSPLRNEAIQVFNVNADYENKYIPNEAQEEIANKFKKYHEDVVYDVNNNIISRVNTAFCDPRSLNNLKYFNRNKGKALKSAIRSKVGVEIDELLISCGFLDDLKSQRLSDNAIFNACEDAMRMIYLIDMDSNDLAELTLYDVKGRLAYNNLFNILDVTSIGHIRDNDAVKA